MKVPELEAKLGMQVYGTRTFGMGGSLRQLPEDFVVNEVLIDGSMAEVPERESKIGGKGEHLVCILVKRNWDTLLVVKKIARKLHLGSGRMRFAGIKDKRALTTQFISVWNIAPMEIRRIRIKDVHLYPLYFSGKPIRLGQLLGNRFEIVVRRIEGEANIIEKGVQLIREELEALGGVPNFYGHQRFGTIRPITHTVGASIIRGRFEEATFAFLTEPSPYERLEAQMARQRLRETNDYGMALKDFPKDLKFEISILNHLVKRSGDYLGALRRLPLKLRRLFVQACQSHIFNMLLSRRISLGLPLREACVGDCVVKVDENGLPTGDLSKVTGDNLEDVDSIIRDGKACLGLPMMGFKTRLSGGLQGDIERQILEKKEIRLENFRVPLMPEVSEAGGYRMALTPIRNFAFSKPVEDDLNPSFFRVSFSFQLIRGSYATIVMREFMKPSDIIFAGF